MKKCTTKKPSQRDSLFLLSFLLIFLSLFLITVFLLLFELLSSLSIIFSFSNKTTRKNQAGKKNSFRLTV